ncbi:steroid receptor-associated and regulated protein [Oryctolagus cuniculus]|uniref:steroid receptor-associated and regulated protein n=1 Tax=Oryctolagus cuniculus TaxID=9986 RepID=UPI002230C0C7|nr:steroid receptor-associated and regulated protein [Oryctolagus cuniculus]
MAPSEDSRDWRASLKDPSLGTHLETSSGWKPVRPQKAIPKAHLTFLIDCGLGKQLPLATPPVPRRGPRPRRGPAAPPVKTYIVFCGGSEPGGTQYLSPGWRPVAQARDTLPPCRGVEAPASSPVGPFCPQESPKAKGSPSKAGPARSSTWGTVKGSLKALSSCVCRQAD